MKKNFILIIAFIFTVFAFEAHADRYFIEEAPKEIESIAGSKVWNRSLKEKGYNYNRGVIEQANIGKTKEEIESGIYQGKIFIDCQNCPKMVVLPKDKNTNTYTAIAQTEITFFQYNQCVADKICKKNRYTKNKAKRNFGELLIPAYPDEYPVIYVNYEDTQNYIKWLNQKTSKNYSLLNDEDWKNLDELVPQNSKKIICKDCDNEYSGQLMQSGFFKNDKYKINDLYGSVWEYIEHSPTEELTKLKGGSWLDSFEDIVNFDSKYVPLETKANNIGFRVKTIITN